MYKRDRKRPDEYAAFLFCAIGFVLCLLLALIQPEVCKTLGDGTAYKTLCVD